MFYKQKNVSKQMKENKKNTKSIGYVSDKDEKIWITIQNISAT